MELLSPAANPEVALAAFDGGADAVYCGLGKFNARERAENFTPDTMGRLIRFARENGKKVYVTLNTLIKEAELGELFEMLCSLAKLSPDALIVQDPGVIEIARRYFPELTLHASTQMGIHNSAGVAAAAALGIKRVILERQVTMEELRSISANSPVELEVFIHGSLCCSLSGRCLLSEYLNGSSGNRGTCKQPCRKQYFVNGRGGYLLSPGDLCGVELIDELRRMGITSLKIEGRLRSPDYVWKTARAYRILLDAAPGDREAQREAEKLLNSSASRNRSEGFYFLKRDRDIIIDKERDGAFGKCVATVEKALRSGLMVKCCDILHLGDRLRLVPPGGGEGESFSLIKMERRRGEMILRSRSGERCFIPGKFSAGENWSINKIGENGFDFSRRASSLPEHDLPLEMSIKCSAKRWEAAFTGKFADLPHWVCETDFAPAEKHPLAAADVMKVFSEGAPEKWYLCSICAEIEGKFFVPAAELKKMRRSFWEFMEKFLDADKYFSDIPQKMESFFQENRELSDMKIMVVDLKEFFIIPPFVSETELKKVQSSIGAAYSKGVRKFAVTGMHGFEMLKELDGIEMITLFPFPAANSRAAALAASQGAVMCEAESELTDSEASSLAPHCQIPLFKRERKDIPLLVTRLPLPAGVWKDRAGNRFCVQPTGEGISEIFICQE